MRRKQSGITLIELMITVGIVAILTAIAYPSYRQQVLRGNRTEGKAELLEAAQELEKCYTRFGAYNNANCTARGTLTGAGRASEAARYQISLVAGTPNPTTEYTLQAVPQNGQEVDSCGTLTLDQTGLRSSATPADTKCW
jgi:type IV pilus assembly protein PilE